MVETATTPSILVACRDGLQATADALHPGLGLGPRSPPLPPVARSARTAASVVLVHGQQRTVPDGRRVAENRMSHGRVDASEGGSHPKPVSPTRDPCPCASTRHRHRRESQQTCRRIRHATLRHGHHPVRPGPRGVSEVPLRTGTGALEHARSLDRRIRANRATYEAFERTAADLETRIGFRPRVAQPLLQRKENHMPNDDTVSVRYLVNDVEASSTSTPDCWASNAHQLRAGVRRRQRGNLRLLLSGPKSSAGRPMQDGGTTRPGGWNRIHLIVDDIDGEIARLRRCGRLVPHSRSWKDRAANRCCCKIPPTT